MNEKTYKIKGLVWRTRHKNKEKESHFAETHLHSYYIEREKKKCWLWRAGSSISCKSIEDGKAKAESDWLERILPALEEVKEGES